MSKKLNRPVMQDNLRKALAHDRVTVLAELCQEYDAIDTEELLEMLLDRSPDWRITVMHEIYCEGQSQSEIDGEEGSWLDKQR